jgi:hypothetical protein
VRWNALRVGDRLHFVIEEAGDKSLLGIGRDGSVTELRPREGLWDVSNLVVVCELDEPLPFNGGLLHEVTLKARHVQTLTVTLLSRYQAVYVSPVLPGPYDFKTVFGLAWLRKLRRCAPPLAPKLK